MMAMETNQQERWCEAEVHRIAGEIALESPQAGTAKTLAPLYEWFTEGFDTRDLKEAKALLDELTA